MHLLATHSYFSKYINFSANPFKLFWVFFSEKFRNLLPLNCMQGFKLHHYSISVYITWSLPLKGYPAPVFHRLCCWNKSCWKSSLHLFSFCLFFSSLSLCLSLQVWSLQQPDWHCKIDEGSIGLLSSRWSPDGRHILNTTEFHVSVKSVCAWLLAFMCSGVCLCTSLSGFNCCWPVKKGNLKIARHQSLSWPPPHSPNHHHHHHPPDTCIQPDFTAALLLASCRRRWWRTSSTLVKHPEGPPALFGGLSY